MNITLDQILNLVGTLNDSPGDDTSRERFRHYLKEQVTEVGRFRDYIEECLRKKGDQYNRALQDLVNHLGYLMDFEVNYGRYRGVQGVIGFDGHWKSSSGIHFVVEVKTTETYTINTSTLLGYIDKLVSEKTIPTRENTLGLYVIGRPDPEVRQLENSIIAEKLTEKLRIISVESLLSLAELMNDYEVTHHDVLSIILPSKPTLDPVVDLMSRLVAGSKTDELPIDDVEQIDPVSEVTSFWLTAVKSDKDGTAEQSIRSLVGKAGIYAFGDRTPGRKRVKRGDMICFYESGKGVVAHARITTKPERKPHASLDNPEMYPWTFKVDNSKFYFEKPVVIDVELRSKLNYFKGRDLSRPWAWFVQVTRKIDGHDFELLTRK